MKLLLLSLLRMNVFVSVRFRPEGLILNVVNGEVANQTGVVLRVQLLLGGGPIALFQWDNVDNRDFKDFNIMEIQPPQ